MKLIINFVSDGNQDWLKI